MFPKPTYRAQKKGNVNLITRESLRPENLLRGRRRHGEHISHRSLDGLSSTVRPVSETKDGREQHISKMLEKNDGYSFDSLPSIHDSHRHSRDYRLGQGSSHSSPIHLSINSGNSAKRRRIVADVPIFLPLFARGKKSNESTTPEAVSSSHQHTAARMSHGTSHQHTAARMSHGTSHQHTAARMSHGTSHQHAAIGMPHSNSQQHTAIGMPHSYPHQSLPVRLPRGSLPQHSEPKKIHITISPSPLSQERAVLNTNDMIGSDSLLNEPQRIKLSSFNRNNKKLLLDESDADIEDRFPRINGDHKSKNKVIWFPDANPKKEIDVIYNDSNYGYRSGEYLHSIIDYNHHGSKHAGRPYQVSPEVGIGNGTPRDRERNDKTYHHISGPKYDSRYNGHIGDGYGNSRFFSE